MTASIISRLGQANIRNILILSLLASGTFGYFAIRPMHRSIQSLRAEIDAKQRMIQHGNQQKLLADQLQSELAATRIHTSQWQSLSPRRENVTRIYAAIDQSAKSSGISIKKFTPHRDQPGKSICTCPVTFTVEGGFEELCEFLRLIDNLSPIAWTTDITIRRVREPGNRESSEVVVADINLSIFADNRVSSG